jgi:hypothetical protein
MLLRLCSDFIKIGPHAVEVEIDPETGEVSVDRYMMVDVVRRSAPTTTIPLSSPQSRRALTRVGSVERLNSAALSGCH